MGENGCGGRYSAFLILFSTTLGKMLFHLKVVNTRYQKVSIGKVIIRETIGKIISGLVLNLGYLWILVDDKKQGWHDKIAGTYVVGSKSVTSATQEVTEKQQESKRSSIPLILMIFGIFEILFVLMISMTIIPKLASVYADFGDKTYITPYILLSLGLLGSLSEVIYGTVIWFEQRKSGGIVNRHKSVGKVLLVIGILLFTILVSMLVMLVIMPIYSLTSQF